MPEAPPAEWRKVLVANRSLPADVAQATADENLKDLYRALPKTFDRRPPATAEDNMNDLLSWLSMHTGQSVSSLRRKSSAELRTMSMAIVNRILLGYRERRATEGGSRHGDTSAGSGYSKKSSMTRGSQYSGTDYRPMQRGELPHIQRSVPGRSVGGSRTGSGGAASSAFGGSGYMLGSLAGSEAALPPPELNPSYVEGLLRQYALDDTTAFSEQERIAMVAYSQSKQKDIDRNAKRLQAAAKKRAQKGRRPSSSMNLPELPRPRGGPTRAGRSSDMLPSLSGPQPKIMKTRSGRTIRPPNWSDRP